MNNKPRNIKPDEIDYILSLRKEDITMEKLNELFTHTLNKPAMFNSNDRFTLPKDKLHNSKELNTTVGRYIVNLFLLYPTLTQFIGYNNNVLDSKNIGKLEGEIAALLLDDKITPHDFIEYINRSQWLGYSISHTVSPGYGYDIIQPLQSVTKRKNELVKQHEEAIKNNDALTMTNIETELVKLAENELREKEIMGMEYYDSGTSKGFGNNYKQTSVMRGAIVNNSEEGKFRLSDSNLMEGIPKEDFYKFADLPVTGSHSRAIGTRQGGYLIIITCSPCKTKLL